MRATPHAVLPIALLAAACARVQPLQATDPRQAIDGIPNEAQAEVAGVTVRAAIGGWRGEPRTLEQSLTPVDVTVQNSSNHVIRVGPESFTLRTPGGPRRPLDQNEAAWVLNNDLVESRRDPIGPRIGAAHGPTFPGFDRPGDPNAPWARSAPGAPTPQLMQWYETQSPSGTLAPGAKTSIMLFFGTPTRTLASAVVEVDLVDEQGTALGTVRLPFARD